jgi:hypothetical protein
MKRHVSTRVVWLLESQTYQSYIRKTGGEWGPRHLPGATPDEAMKFTSREDAMDVARDYTGQHAPTDPRPIKVKITTIIEDA